MRSMTMIAAAVAVGAALPSAAQEATVVRFSPKLLQLDPGQTAIVEVLADNVGSPGLAAIQIDLDFDPAVVRVRDPNEQDPTREPFAPGAGEWLLTSSSRQPLGTSLIDPQNGRVQFAYGTSGSSPPPTGGGVIGRILVEAEGNGAVRVRLVEPILSDGEEPPADHPKRVGSLAVIVGSGHPDQDGDGMPDGVDNCAMLPNGPSANSSARPPQSDIDLDGFGDLCDCDLNNDGGCGQPDYTIFLACFGQTTGPGASGSAADPTCEESDMNGDGGVGQPDYTLFLGRFGQSPGP